MKVFHDLPWAQLGQVSPNELGLDQKHPSLVPPEGKDTVKFRIGSWAGMFGWISGDRLHGDERNPNRSEKVGIKLGEGPGDCGVLEVHLMKPNATDDEDMVKVVTMTPSGIEFHVPVTGLLMGKTDRMVNRQSERFVTVQQGDGNFVTYDTAKGPVGEPSAAVWSAWGGKA